MKVGDIGRILQREFPGRFVSFTVNVDKHSSGSVETSIELYDSVIGFVKGPDFETCFQRLRDMIYPETIVADFSIES